MECHCPST